MDKAKRTSKEIEAELDGLRAKVRALEAEKQEHGKALDKAQRERKKSAYAAHSDGDAKAKDKLSKARTAQRESELALEDLESAIAEGRARFDRLEREWKAALDAEAWAALMAEAELARKEAAEIDKHIDGFSKLLAAHGKRLEHLKNTAFNLGIERAFRTVGLRHVDRIFDWRLIQAGFAGEFEKPSEQYRKASGYAEILAEQIAAAQVAHDQAMKEAETNRQGSNGHDPEIQPGADSENGAETEAGAGA